MKIIRLLVTINKEVDLEMLNYIKSENLKYKNTFSRKLLFIAPLFFMIYAFYAVKNLESQENYFMQMVFNWWPLIFIPLGSALLCSLSSEKEKKSGNYNVLLSNNLSMCKVWLSKISIIAFYTLISSLILVLVVVLYGLLAPNIIVSFGNALYASIIIWITSLGLIPIYLFISTRFGMILSIGTSFIFSLIGVGFADKPVWVFIPWSWALRLMSPIIGVHPNGVALNPGNPLLDYSVVPIGVIVSLLFFITTVLLTSIWFSKREVN